MHGVCFTKLRKERIRMSFTRTSLLKILKKSDGIALFVAILVMTVVMLFIGGV